MDCETILTMKNEDHPYQCEKRDKEDFADPTGAQSCKLTNAKTQNSNSTSTGN